MQNEPNFGGWAAGPGVGCTNKPNLPRRSPCQTKPICCGRPAVGAPLPVPLDPIVRNEPNFGELAGRTQGSAVQTKPIPGGAGPDRAWGTGTVRCCTNEPNLRVTGPAGWGGAWYAPYTRGRMRQTKPIRWRGLRSPPFQRPLFQDSNPVPVVQTNPICGRSRYPTIPGDYGEASQA